MPAWLPRSPISGALLALLAACGGGSQSGSSPGASPAPTPTPTPAPPPPPIDTSAMVPGWTLIWHDEFEQEGLPDNTKRSGPACLNSNPRFISGSRAG